MVCQSILCSMQAYSRCLEHAALRGAWVVDPTTLGGWQLSPGGLQSCLHQQGRSWGPPACPETWRRLRAPRAQHLPPRSVCTGDLGAALRLEVWRGAGLTA